MDDFLITSQHGRVYKGLRAYRIALGHAVRQALINFAKEVEDYCQERVAEFYGEYNPSYYDRTGQLLDKMKLQQLIKTEIRGNFQGNVTFEIDVFDWEVLDAHENGYGEFGTYTSFSGEDSRGNIEEYFSNGIYGHNGFNLREDVKQYIDNKLEKVIEDVINNF